MAKKTTQLPTPPTGKSGWPWLADTEFEKPDGNKKWSVVIPSYNQVDFLEAAIRSVLLQSTDFEVIVIDGGSTDGSVEVLERYDKHLAFWVSEPDRGQSHAINKGLKRATGDLLHWLNSDDLVLPGAFAIVEKLFAANPGARLVTGQATIIDAEGRHTGIMPSRFTTWTDFATRKNVPRQVGTFFDLRVFDELGMIDESIQWSMDSDLMLRFTRRYNPVMTDELLTAYRVHGETKFDHHPVVGYREADAIYLRHMKGTRLSGEFKKWSADHWMLISRRRDLSIAERSKSLAFALDMRPALALSPRFWKRAARVAVDRLTGKRG